MIPRLLNTQGIVGLAISAGLALLLLLAKNDARHWKKQSGQFEQLYHAEQSAHASTVANYRAAAEVARAADQANVARVTAEQRSINERTADDYQTRLADARALADRLRDQASSAAADSGGGRTALVSGVADATGGVAEGSQEDRLPQSDALTATEQAIQLDELIKWVRRQGTVDNGGRPKVTSNP